MTSKSNIIMTQKVLSSSFRDLETQFTLLQTVLVWTHSSNTDVIVWKSSPEFLNYSFFDPLYNTKIEDFLWRRRKVLNLESSSIYCTLGFSIYVLFQLSESYSINTMNFKSPMASSTHYAFNAF